MRLECVASRGLSVIWFRSNRVETMSHLHTPALVHQLTRKLARDGSETGNDLLLWLQTPVLCALLMQQALRDLCSLWDS